MDKQSTSILTNLALHNWQSLSAFLLFQDKIYTVNCYKF